MLFASIPLAQRIERADCRILEDSVTAVTRRHPDANVASLAIAGGLAAYTTEGSPFNKVSGIGFDGPIEEAELEAVERMFAERGAPVQIELSNLGEPSIGEFLTRRGYVLKGFENVLGRPLPTTEAPKPGPGIEVVECPPDDLEAWVDIVATGFANPDTQGVPSHDTFERDAIAQVIADFVSADGVQRYLARRDGVPAGGGSLRLFEGICQLCGAATLPEHRGRGVQTALLATRLSDASAAGCDVATVTTQPGSKSAENVQRRGFELLYTRAILVLDSPERREP